MKIQEALNNISNATLGKDVRKSIHDGIEQCYKDATGNPESVAHVKKMVENAPYIECSEEDDLELPIHSINDKEISKNSTWSSKQIVDMIYPIGSVYITVNNINPQTYLGGKWKRWGQGRGIIGVNESDSDFNEANKTGGSKTVTLTVGEIPAHTHGEAGDIATVSNIIGQKNSSGTSIFSWDPVNSYGDLVAGNGDYAKTPGSITINTTHQHTSIGGGDEHENMSPYITAYMWIRTE